MTDDGDMADLDGACRQAAALVYIDRHISFHRLTSSNSVLFSG